MVLGVGKANKGKMIARESLRYRETLDGRLVFYFIKVSGVIIAGQLMDDGWNVVSDCPEIPNVVFEKWMIDDFVNPFLAQSKLPAMRRKIMMERPPKQLT